MRLYHLKFQNPMFQHVYVLAPPSAPPAPAPAAQPAYVLAPPAAAPAPAPAAQPAAVPRYHLYQPFQAASLPDQRVYERHSERLYNYNPHNFMGGGFGQYGYGGYGGYGAPPRIYGHGSRFPAPYHPLI